MYYLKCIKGYKDTDEDGHTIIRLELNKIYKTWKKELYNTRLYYGETWISQDILSELSKVEVFVELKGNMDLVEDLP